MLFKNSNRRNYKTASRARREAGFLGVRTPENSFKGLGFRVFCTYASHSSTYFRCDYYYLFVLMLMGIIIAVSFIIFVLFLCIFICSNSIDALCYYFYYYYSYYCCLLLLLLFVLLLLFFFILLLLVLLILFVY